MTESSTQSSLFLSVGASISGFLASALCPGVLFFLCSRVDLTAHMWLEWATRVQLDGFWVYEAALALLAGFVLKRGTHPVHRYSAWGVLLGCMVGVGLGVWIRSVVIQGMPVIGP